MTRSITNLGHGTLSTSASAIVNASYTTKITSNVFSNKSAAAVTVSVYYVESGETTSSSGAFLGSKKIQPGRSWMFHELSGLNMAESANIYASASANSAIDYNISGDVINE